MAGDITAVRELLQRYGPGTARRRASAQPADQASDGRTPGPDRRE